MTKPSIIILAAALACWPSLPPAEGAESLSKVFKRVDPSVVIVQTNRHQVVTGPKMQLANLSGLGSGVLISRDGKVMTAAHVVQTADAIKVEFVNGESVPARVRTSDPAAVPPRAAHGQNFPRRAEDDAG